MTTFPSGRAGRALRPTSGPRSIRHATRPCEFMIPRSDGGARGTRETYDISVTLRTGESGIAYRLPPWRQITARGMARSCQLAPGDERLQVDGSVGQVLRRAGDVRGHP